ncbi:MAG: gluconate 2-dehydrogenase subunit 3 family protein [Terriglobales bacterium]
MQAPGFYPGYDLIAQQGAWDAATRKLVLQRLAPPPPLRFFAAAEAALLSAVCDRMLPQSDRPADRRIPIVPVIDQRLAAGRIPGYRYADMPPDGEAHRLGLQAIAAMAEHLYHCDFGRLDGRQQDAVLLSIHDGHPHAAAAIWARMSVVRYWRLLLDDVLTAYYAHPWAWEEIGFGGPAYPRGYMRLARGQREPWERPERRHPFHAPPDSLSGDFTPLAEAGPCWPRKSPR